MPALQPVPMMTELASDALAGQYRAVRDLSVALAAPLSDADATVQSMADASPSKWHLAHTSWFFETFVLRDYVRDYWQFDGDFHFLFNSYYEAEGERHNRAARGMITRPALDRVLAYRAHVDAAMQSALPGLPGDARSLVTLGLNHEQQHQELLLTDILHLFAQNPCSPAMWPQPEPAPSREPSPLTWIEGQSGQVAIGHDGQGFAFDCEGPRHDVLLTRHALASRTVTNGEWLAFIEDGGYARASHWLADGWDWVQREHIAAPLYWRQDDEGQWRQFGLTGLVPIDPHAPVSHISLYEADAYADWTGMRLPTEAEWESAAAGLDTTAGNLLDTARPVAPEPASASGLTQMFGTVWEWTGSAYRPYPGFRAAPGAVGEYNGKFMSGQFVLKGGSCATPRGHLRASYRNFFYPHQRWQFAGVRLARDL